MLKNEKNNILILCLTFFLFIWFFLQLEVWPKNRIHAEESAVFTPSIALKNENSKLATVVSVGDVAGLEAAMKDVTVTDIEITNSFALTGIGTAAELNQTIPSRSITINGNGHTIDFRGRSYQMSFGQNQVELMINNLEMFGQNYWGPVRLIGNVAAHSTIDFTDISYTGAQLTYSAESDVEIRGDVIVKSVNQYISPFDTNTYSAQVNQVNFQITNITFKEDSTYKGTTENADVMLLMNGGKMIAEKNSKIELTRGGNAGEGGYNVLQVDGDLIVRESAEISLNTVQDSTRGGIWLTSANSSVLVEEDATLIINTNGPINAGSAAALFASANTSVEISNGGKLFINALNSGNSTRPIVSTGNNSSFVIAKEGTFDVQSDGTGAKDMISIGATSTFQFADAARVNLQLDNTNANSRLISMSGSAGFLDIDVQSVKAWTATDWVEDTNESFLWTPMYDMKVNYSGSNTTTATGKSITNAIQSSFISDFRTQNFRRVLFEYISDVDIAITRPLSNNVESTESHIIKGVAYPGSFVRLSLVDENGINLLDQSILPTGTIESQVESEQGDSNNNYQTNADASGNWTVSLESGKYLEAGMRMKAYAFLNGKEDFDIALVIDRVPPGEPILNSIKDQDRLVTGTADPKSIVQLYREKDDSQIGLDTEANDSGVYTIGIPETAIPLVPYELLYTTASNHSEDEDGGTIINTSEKSNLQEVIDTTPPTADPLPVIIHLDEGIAELDLNPKNYVTNVLDNQDAIEGKTYTFEFLVGKGPESVEVDKIGGSSVIVRVFDQAKNYVDVTVGISIIDESVVLGETTFLKAEDFGMSVSEFSGLTTPELLHAEILNRSHASAWNKVTGVSVVTEIEHDGGLSDLIGTYTVSIQALDSIPETYVRKPIVGKVTGGSLNFSEVPNNIDFGSQKIKASTEKYAPIEDICIVIEDSRGQKANWELYLTVEEDLTLSTNPDVELIGALHFINESNEEIEINGEAGLVYSQQDSEALMETIIQWNGSLNQGLLLQIDPNQSRIGSYIGKVNWLLVDGPES